MHVITAEEQESTSCDISTSFSLLFLSVCLWKCGHPTIHVSVNNLFLQAIALLNDCYVSPFCSSTLTVESASRLLATNL